MATLEHVTSHRRFPLPIRTVVGRSQSCELRLASPQASGLHAELVWDGERWFVHDLGSRNGTYVDGQRLESGQREPLVLGTEIMFGADGECFILVDASVPGLVAVAEDGTTRSAAGGSLGLPSDAEPGARLLEQADGRWLLEAEARSGERVAHRQQIVVAGTCWCIHLPGVVRATTQDDQEPLSVSNIALEFRVNRNGDHAEVRIRGGSRSIDLKPRTHDFILLQLARARLADQQRPELDGADHGWVNRQDLCRDLQLDRKLLNLQMHRARQQFAEAGVTDTSCLVEHRRRAKQLRLGVSRLSVLPL